MFRLKNLHCSWPWNHWNNAVSSFSYSTRRGWTYLSFTRVPTFRAYSFVSLLMLSHCIQSEAVLFFWTKYRLGHPENYLFLLSKNIFSGSKYPKNIKFNFENRRTGLWQSTGWVGLILSVELVDVSWEHEIRFLSRQLIKPPFVITRLGSRLDNW